MDELDLFAAAIDITDRSERDAFLNRECSDRPELRERLDLLLDQHAQSHHLLDRPDGLNYDTATILNSELSLVGSEIAGRYKLLEQIGEGGMGTVWVAEQTEPVKRKVALKLIKAGMDSNAVLARFEAERQALAMMDHPNIAKVLDGGLTESGRPYFVMEYVKGVPITEYCDSLRLSVHERLHLFVQVCSAVQHAHQKGIIHRDLKPSNILVAPYDDKPVPKVIDFGLAKALHQRLTERTIHTAHETVIGTPLYMSPEQAQLNNLDVDTRSDIYSLGVLLYELLTGTTPLEKDRFKEAAWEEIRRIIRDEEPPRPSTRLSSTGTLPSLAACRQTEPVKLTQQLKGELDWIVMKSLEKERTRRYETATGLALDVQRYLNGEAVEACPPTFAYRMQKAYQKHRTSVLTAGTFIALLFVALFVTTRLAIKNQKLAQVAQELANESQLNAVRAQKNAEQETEQRKLAEEQAAAAKAVSDFLFDDVISALDPAEQEDVDITLREVIDNAREQLPVTFKDAPRELAEIELRLGQAYCYLKEGSTGRTMLHDAYELRKLRFGPENDETLEALETFLKFQRGGPKTAELTNTLLDLRRKTKGEDDPDTLRAQVLATRVQARQLEGSGEAAGSERWQEIEQEYLSILDKQRHICGEDHADVLETMRSLGNAVYYPQYHYEDMHDIGLKCLEMSQKKYGVNHPQTFRDQTTICIALAGLREYDELEKEARAVIQRRDSFNSLNRSTMADFLMLSYMGRGRGSEGLKACEEYVNRPDTREPSGRLVIAYAMYGSRETYEKYAAARLNRHENSQSFLELSNAANVYLLVPPMNQELLDKAVGMARRATDTPSEQGLYYLRAVVRGMAEYRAGEYKTAKTWLSDPAIKDAGVSYPVSRVYLAMTEFKLGNLDGAQSLLEESKAVISQLRQSRVFKHYTWANVIRAELALKEATALIEGETQQIESLSP